MRRALFGMDGQACCRDRVRLGFGKGLRIQSFKDRMSHRARIDLQAHTMSIEVLERNFDANSDGPYPLNASGSLHWNIRFDICRSSTTKACHWS